MDLGSGNGSPIDSSQLRNTCHSPNEAFTEDKLVSKDPMTQFEYWFDEAVKGDAAGANTMTLATVGSDGRPSARIVALKGFGQDGFKFFTNYRSKKGLDLMVNPYVALVFYWPSLQRSVRIEGKAEKMAEEDSLEYFRSRPRPNQISSHVSEIQSSPVESRSELLLMADKLRKKFLGTEVSKPPYWGGYLVKPNAIEFWHGQTDRMHDRIRFRNTTPDVSDSAMSLLKKGENGWWYERLMP